jgi:hypothetical protein
MNSTVTDVKPKTTEQVRADKRKRVIANAGKAAKRTSLKLSSPLPKAHTPKAPVFNPSPVVPTFSLQTLKSFDMAVKGLKAQGRSLNQRLLICHHHLQSHPALSAIRPEELLKEIQNK